MEHFISLLHTLFSFFVILSVIVFIHEFGHYIVAKLCGVRIVAFSIGFGKELFGWTDRSGTRWKVSLLPLGGYVKMYGDANAASTANAEALAKMSDAEKAQSFHFQPLRKKAAIVAAGPAANFLLTIALFTYFIFSSGLPSTEPVIGEVMKDSPAAEAGLQVGDRIIRINDTEIHRFNDIPYLLATNVGTPVTVYFTRADAPMQRTITPRQTEDEDGLGNKIKRPLIGIRSQEMNYEEVGLLRSLAEAVKRTYYLCETTIEVVGQMLTGQRGADELRGPVGIAQLSGQATDKGISTTLWFIAMLSANLGLVNLFPIPMLDGGHLLYYAAEAARGKPLAQRVQEYGFRLGLAVLAMLMAFTLINDVRQLLF